VTGKNNSISLLSNRTVYNNTIIKTIAAIVILIVLIIIIIMIIMRAN
jgi:hypothetical protein